MIVTAIIHAAAFTSLWCAYATLASVLIYLHFHVQHSAERESSMRARLEPG